MLCNKSKMGGNFKLRWTVKSDLVRGFVIVCEYLSMYLPPAKCMYIPHFSGHFPLPFRLAYPPTSTSIQFSIYPCSHYWTYIIKLISHTWKQIVLFSLIRYTIHQATALVKHLHKMLRYAILDLVN